QQSHGIWLIARYPKNQSGLENFRNAPEVAFDPANCGGLQILAICVLDPKSRTDCDATTRTAFFL
ncbi:MAG TPA: hypothetical protein PK509_17825, partial [Catalimonadaceae bacterium]|nr:hypothetical protein [Catalimonadaceae bacterium]